MNGNIFERLSDPATYTGGYCIARVEARDPPAKRLRNPFTHPPEIQECMRSDSNLAQELTSLVKRQFSGGKL